MKKIAKSLIIRPGTMKTWENGRWASIYCKIKLNERENLSIRGVIGPLSNGDALGGCGQIDMEFQHRNPEHDNHRYPGPIQPRDIKFRPGWTVNKWYTFLEYWKLYHLNALRPGCEHQTAEGWGQKEVEVGKETKSTNWLTEKEHPEGVLLKPCPVCGYKYGSAWKRQEVPREALDFLFSLPMADQEPTWV